MVPTWLDLFPGGASPLSPPHTHTHTHTHTHREFTMIHCHCRPLLCCCCLLMIVRIISMCKLCVSFVKGSTYMTTDGQMVTLNLGS